MKKGCIVLLIALLLLVPIISAETKIFSGTVTGTSRLNISSQIFEFRILESAALVSIGSTGSIVREGDCEIDKGYKACIDSIKFSYKNLSTYEYVYEAAATIYESKPSIKLLKTFSSDELLVGEEASAELTIKNEGSIGADGLAVIESYPAEIQVFDVSTCKSGSNAIQYNGKIGAGQDIICKYKIRALSPITYKSAANASYSGASGSGSATYSYEIKVLNYSLLPSLYIKPRAIESGDEFSAVLSLENINEEEAVTVTSLTLKMPQGIKLLSKPSGMNFNNNMLSWNGALEPNELLNLTLKLKAERTGPKEFELDYSFREKSFFRTLEKKFSINVTCGCPVLNYIIGTLSEGKSANFEVFAENSGEKQFNNLRASYSTDIPGIKPEEFNLGEIGKYSRKNILKESIPSPKKGESYFFDAVISYESDTEERFYVKRKIIISYDSAIAQENRAIEPEEAQKSNTENLQIEKSDDAPEADSATEEPLPGSPVVLEGKSSSLTPAIIIAAVIVLMFLLVLLRVFRRHKSKEIKIERPELKESREPRQDYILEK